MSSRPARIALIGAGPIADAYAAAFEHSADMELVRAGEPTDLASVDFAGAIVTAPDAALATITHGRPVLLNLSGAETADQLDKVRAAAATAGVPLVIARPWRFHEVARAFRTSVDAGDLGPPAFFHWVDEDDSRWPVGDQANGVRPAAGAVAGIDLALWLLGEWPARVYARETGGGVTISLRCQGGANALIERRTGSGTTGHGFAWLLGPRGEARWDQRADGVSVSGGQPPLPLLDVSACFRAQVADALARWAGAGLPGSDVADARRVASTIQAANESVRLGQPVTMSVGEEDGSDA